MKIRILIADDHPVVLVGIKGLVGHCPEFELIGEATDGDKALLMTQELSPDVLMLDINMPGLKTIQILHRIVQQQLPTRVLIMTSYGDFGIVNAMMTAGAKGYLLKDEEPLIIIEAVKAIYDGQVWLSPSIKESIEQYSIGEKEECLNKREIMIVKMISQGFPNKEIARQSGIAERTVEFYVTQMFRKIHVTSRVELALWAKTNMIGGVLE